MQEIKQTSAPKHIDSVTQLRKRLEEFLAQLKTVNELFPEYLGFNFSKKPSWHDVLGSPTRTWQKVWHGQDAATRDKLQYIQLKDIFNRLYVLGNEIHQTLPEREDDTNEQLEKILALKNEAKTVDIFQDYFAVSASIGLIQHTIKPLLSSLAFCVRIQPSKEFVQAFQTLIGLANTRSSKVKLMLTEIDQQSQSKLEGLNADLKEITQRFDMLAKMSDLMATFAIFSRNKPVKTQEQLEREAIAKNLAIESGAKPDERHEIIAIREFISQFGFRLLIPLLQNFKNWEDGHEEALSVLHSSLKILIRIKDNGPVSSKAFDIQPSEYEKLGDAIHAFMAGSLSEAELETALADMRKITIAKQPTKMDALIQAVIEHEPDHKKHNTFIHLQDLDEDGSLLQLSKTLSSLQVDNVEDQLVGTVDDFISVFNSPQDADLADDNVGTVEYFISLFDNATTPQLTVVEEIAAIEPPQPTKNGVKAKIGFFKNIENPACATNGVPIQKKRASSGLDKQESIVNSEVPAP